MQNITTSNDKYATTYSIYDYTTCISVTLCHFCDIYMVFGVVQDEDGNRWIAENDNEFVNVTVSGMPDNQLILTSASGSTVLADIMRDSDNSPIMNGDTIASFTNGQTEADAFYLVHGDASPGDYTGTITFNVSLSSF